MIQNNNYGAEGSRINTVENVNALCSSATLGEAMQQGWILEARAIICDNAHNLVVDLSTSTTGVIGVIPREEGAIGITEGITKDIALITRVNKPVCFKILRMEQNSDGTIRAILSRKAAQEDCMKNYIQKLLPGDIIPAKVTHMEQFGCFVDIGCGIPSLIPIDAISVSRISHPKDRFTIGQNIRVVVKQVENGRVWLSHKELLGTWEENAAQFHPGDTVAGIVRSVEEYGVFIELAPNLAGLAEQHEKARPGKQASVYIKAIIPEKMKIKLIIVDVFDAEYPLQPPNYFTDAKHISSWRYSPIHSNKLIEVNYESK